LVRLPRIDAAASPTDVVKEVLSDVANSKV